MRKIKQLAIFLVIFVVLLSTLSVGALSQTSGSQSGTASVWAGVPLIGHVYVCTPWTANYTRYSEAGYSYAIVNSVTTGQSYTSAGIALIAYQSYSSTANNLRNNLFDVLATGHCDLVFKGCPISLGLQTFKSTESV